MKDRCPGKLLGGTLQAIDHGFVRQENLGVVRIGRHGSSHPSPGSSAAISSSIVSDGTEQCFNAWR